MNSVSIVDSVSSRSKLISEALSIAFSESVLSDVVSALSADVSPVDSVRADSAFTELEDVTAVPHPPKASDDARSRLTTAPVSFFCFFLSVSIHYNSSLPVCARLHKISRFPFLQRSWSIMFSLRLPRGIRCDTPA